MAIISVKSFHKKFGLKTVHKDVNFEVMPGECLGLIGGSGSGKSVLLRSLIGLEKPDAGDILIEGESIITLNEDDLFHIRKKVTYVFQGGALFDSMTVFDNLAYPLREHFEFSEQEIHDKVIAKLKEFGLPSTERLFPNALSGGMQKRVGLARSMMMDPEVVLYDEPTAGLDPLNTKNIQDLILQNKKKKITSILVTHDMPVAYAVCDRMVLLKNGVITENENDIQKFTQGVGL